MGKLVTVIGNSGIGKTTLTKKLCEAGSFTPLLEINEERPFQQRFKDNLKGAALANQVDYLVYHAQQEMLARRKVIVGVQDAGLDQTFHVFTKRFYQKGFLDDEEYRLCERLYATLRQLLPVPDLMIYLSAPPSIIVERMTRRNRDIEIEKARDLEALQDLLDAWLVNITEAEMIQVDVSEDDPMYDLIIDDLLREVRGRLGI